MSDADAEQQLAEGLLAETREEVARADGKASILLAAAGVGVSALVGGILTANLSLDGERGIVQLLAAAASLAVTAGIVALGAAVLPDVGSPEKGRVRFFTDVLEYSTTQQLKAALRDEASLGHERTLQQLLAVSSIVGRKYRRTWWGEIALAAGLALALVAALGHWRLG